jgi:protein-arginine kinase activator protein McsA
LIKERQITVSAWLRNNLSETLAADCDFEGAAHPKDNIEALKEMTANLQKYSL